MVSRSLHILIFSLIVTLLVPVFSLGSEGLIVDFSKAGVAEDKYIGGASTCTILQKDSVLRYRYTLNPSKTFPFAGVKVPISPLQGSDGLKLIYSTPDQTNIRVILKAKIPGVTTNDPATFRFYEYEFSPNAELVKTRSRQIREIFWNDFQIPSWYASVREIPTEKRLGIPKNDLSKMEWIEVLSGYSADGLTSAEVSLFDIQTISLSAISPKTLVVIALLFAFAGAFFSTIIRGRKEDKKHSGKYRSMDSSLDPVPIKTSSQSDESAQRELDDFELVREYLSKNYMNSTMNLELLSSELKLNSHRVNGVFKSGFQKPFKTVLNDLRMVEAYRLLKMLISNLTTKSFNVYLSPH